MSQQPHTHGNVTCTFLRLFADDVGVTRVDSGYSRPLASVAFSPPAPPMFFARLSDASAFVIVELPVGWEGGWHPSPKEQWVICLAGEMGLRLGTEAGSRWCLARAS